MSKCIKCGKELLSGDEMWEQGLCNNCYDEKILNQYPFKQGIIEKDQQIAELKKQLEEQNKNLEYARQLSYKSLLGVEDDYQDLKQENQQLKQQLEEKDKTIEMLKSIDRYDIGEMLTENVKLKAELHTQPKEIVEKIKEYINTNAYYYEEECFAEHVNSYLDEILKEYGEE